MHERQNALNDWLNQIYPHMPFSLTPLTGDASFRRYFRITYNNETFIVMDAPPEKELISPFVHISRLLRNIGVHTPKIYHRDEQQGFLLLEDFGDQLLLNVLGPENSDDIYQAAMNVLIKMQQNLSHDSGLPVFDKSYILEQMQLFQHWFLDQYLGINLNDEERSLIQNSFTFLCNELLKQPYAFTHCDYHSRNVMLLSNTHEIDLGIIDFQDAMYAPVTYDLASLLKDCYIYWPTEKRHEWLIYFYNKRPAHKDMSFKDFHRGFDMCGIQRHLKVLGIFSRLHLRDNKSGYIKDLPQTLRYLLESLKEYDDLAAFYDLMAAKIYPLFKTTHRL